MIMPLVVGEDLRGMLWLAVKPNHLKYSPNERALLSYLGSSIGYIIYNMECITRLERRALNIITGLGKASEQRDEYSSGHSERVSSYATMFARHLGVSHLEVEIIRRAGLMHDIGKIGISEAILNKPGKLTMGEFEKIKSHPIYAAEFLKILGFLQQEQILILHHHEKFDGSGYPYGLSGSQIPRGSIILSLCDVFDALTHKQSYREAYSIDEALNIMGEMKEKNFEPAHLDHFFAFIRERIRNVQQNATET
jgi:putative nucleotidyltransferase with HDIG domain